MPVQHKLTKPEMDELLTKLMLAVDTLLCNTEDPNKVLTRVCFASTREVDNLRRVYKKVLEKKYGDKYSPMFEQAKPAYRTKEE